MQKICRVDGLIYLSNEKKNLLVDSNTLNQWVNHYYNDSVQQIHWWTSVSRLNESCVIMLNNYCVVSMKITLNKSKISLIHCTCVDQINEHQWSSMYCVHWYHVHYSFQCIWGKRNQLKLEFINVTYKRCSPFDNLLLSEPFLRLWLCGNKNFTKTGENDE